MRYYLACALAIVVIVLAGLPPALYAQEKPISFDITAGKWHSTGIILGKDQAFQLDAAGEVRSSSDANHKWGPGGYYHLGFRAFSVKAKVGDEFYEVNDAGTLSAVTKVGGELLLGMSYTYDPKPEEAGWVSGSFSVTVSASGTAKADPPSSASLLPKLTVGAVSGGVRFRVGNGQWQPMTVGQELPPNSEIVTATDGSLTLTAEGGSSVTFNPSARFNYQYLERISGFFVQEGRVRFSLRRDLYELYKWLFVVETRGVNVGVKGTDFEVAYDEATQTTFVSATEGKVLVTPKNPTLSAVMLGPGGSAEVTPTTITTAGNSEPAGREEGTVAEPLTGEGGALLQSAEAEPNDRFSQTNSIAPSGTVAATISPKGDTDWYKVTFPSPGVLDVVIPGVPADGEADGVSIRLFNDNADVVYDWAGPVRKGEPTMPIWDITKAGVYYFQVAENYSDATVTYSLQTKFTPAADAGEPNDAFSKAIPIQPNTPIQAYIFPKGDTDWYYFDMPGRSKLHVLVTDVPKEMDMAIRIYNADAGVIYDWYVAAHPGEKTENNYDFKEPGRYYLQVADSYSDARSTATYTLSFDISPAVDPLEASDRFADTLPITADQEVLESIFPREDTDWYKLAVPTPGTLQVSITNYPATMDMVGRVYNADKGVVCDWQGPPRVGADTNFSCDLGVAGTYVIQVADSYSDAWDIGPYHLKYSFVSTP